MTRCTPSTVKCWRVASFILALLGVLLAPGCAGYRLGPTNGTYAGDHTIQIRPFVNETFEPRLTDAVTAQMRKSLQTDGTYKLATHEEGDVVLTGNLTRFQRTEVTLESRDVLSVRDYRLSLTAHVVARERITGKTLLDQQVTGNTLIRVGSDLTSAERQALPLLAGDLAKNITALVVDGKW